MGPAPLAGRCVAVREPAQHVQRAKTARPAPSTSARSLLVLVIMFAVIARDAPADVVAGMRKAICTIARRDRLRRPQPRRRLRRRSLRGLRARPTARSTTPDCGDTPDDPAREGDDGARRRRAGRQGLREPRPRLRLLPRHLRLGLLRRQGRAGGRHRQRLRRRHRRPTGATTRVHFAPGAGDALDTAAHEFTHGVTANTAGLRLRVPVRRPERVDLGHHGLEPRPLGPDLRRGPQRRRRRRSRRRHDPRLPVPRPASASR